MSLLRCQPDWPRLCSKLSKTPISFRAGAASLPWPTRLPSVALAASPLLSPTLMLYSCHGLLLPSGVPQPAPAQLPSSPQDPLATAAMDATRRAWALGRALVGAPGPDAPPTSPVSHRFTWPGGPLLSDPENGQTPNPNSLSLNPEGSPLTSHNFQVQADILSRADLTGASLGLPGCTRAHNLTCWCLPTLPGLVPHSLQCRRIPCHHLHRVCS